MRVSASKVGLLAHCQAFARPEMEWDNRSSEAAERGTRFHTAIARWIASDRLGDFVIEDDIREEYEQAKAWVESLGSNRPPLRVEVAFAWDPATDKAELLGSTNRDYSRGQGKLCGTADLVMLVQNGGAPTAAMVWDWKTGSGENAGPQLRALGLMVARAYQVEHVTVAALEVRASGVAEVAREELDGFALAMLAGELAEQVAAIPTAEPRPGSHCGELYCPARLSCPLGQTAIANVAEVIPAESIVRRPDFRITDPVETPEQAIMTVDVLRLMSAWIDAKKEEIKAKVPANGWQAEDGRVLKETKAKIEAFDKHKALALCKQLGATEEQLGSLYFTFEKSNGLRVSGGGTKRLRRAS
jgi:hypothetical protein